MESPVLASVFRGTTVESIHRGHVVIMDGDGTLISSIGDPETITFFRSAAKPFQAMPLIDSGAAEAYGFEEPEIAMACASHSGQRRHVELVAGMLERIGISESDLRCGTHMPFFEPEAHRLIREEKPASVLHNNCSGKHAAMLAVAKHRGWETSNYETNEHPLQQEILRIVSEYTETPDAEIPIAVDGCAAPNFAVTIAAMARGFTNLVSPAAGATARRIVSAMINYPELIGGSGRLDTVIMQAAPEQIVSKVGADGVWLCGVLPNDKFPKGLGIALKIEDGDDYLSRPVVAVELLRSLGVLTDSDLPDLAPMPVRNRRGDVVGRVEAVKLDHFL